jgi:hypothetical protein
VVDIDGWRPIPQIARKDAMRDLTESERMRDRTHVLSWLRAVIVVACATALVIVAGED